MNTWARSRVSKQPDPANISFTPNGVMSLEATTGTRVSGLTKVIVMLGKMKSGRVSRRCRWDIHARAMLQKRDDVWGWWLDVVVFYCLGVGGGGEWRALLPLNVPLAG